MSNADPDFLFAFTKVANASKQKPSSSVETRRPKHFQRNGENGTAEDWSTWVLSSMQVSGEPVAFNIIQDKWGSRGLNSKVQLYARGRWQESLDEDWQLRYVKLNETIAGQREPFLWKNLTQGFREKCH